MKRILKRFKQYYIIISLAILLVVLTSGCSLFQEPVSRPVVVEPQLSQPIEPPSAVPPEVETTESVDEPSQSIPEVPVSPILETSAVVIGTESSEQVSAGNSASYVVKRGDTLFSIARRCNTSIEAIMVANPEIISPELIYVGQTLTIPNGEQPAVNIPPVGIINLSATLHADSKSTLNWNDVEGEEGYHVYWKVNHGVAWELLGEVPNNAISVPINELKPETTYFFFVQAFNDWGVVNSNEVELTTLPGEVNHPPIGTFDLSATTPSISNITLQWIDIQNEDGYRVFARVSGMPEWQEVDALTAGNTINTVGGLQPSTAYEFYVQAFNGFGVLDSEIITQSTLPESGSGPIGSLNLTATVKSSSVINLQWNDVQDEDGYRIYQSTSSASTWQEIGALPPGSTSESIAGLKVSTTYQFYIQAFNLDGKLDSAVITVSTLSDNVDGAELGLELTKNLRDSTLMKNVCVDGVILASRLGAGGLQKVTTGTVTISDSGTAQYNPSPNDQLHITLANGTQTYCIITTINGNIAQDADTFFTNNHELVTQLSTNLGGLAYDIAYFSQQSGETSFGGFEYRSTTSTQGTVIGSGYELTVNEATEFEIVGFEGETVSASRITFNNSWNIGGENFQLQNGEIKRSFRDGFPSNTDTYWGARGQLLRNNQPYGQLILNNDGTFLKVIMQLPDKASEWERWSK